jgi:hypothetical protein
MDSKKSGTIFIVLMVALLAYGTGSVADALNLDGNAIVNLIPSNFTSFNQQQITPIDDPSFKPVFLIGHVVINTTTNTSSNTTDDNQTNNNQNNG